MIDSITSTYKIGNGAVTTITSNNLPDYLEYSVSYGDNHTLSRYQELKANTTETIKVRVAYKRDIDVDDLLEANQSIAFTFGVEYVQTNNNAVDVDHSMIMYGVYDSSHYTALGQEIQDGTILRNTLEEAIADWANIDGNVDDDIFPICIKLTIEDNIVKDSAVVLVILSELAQQDNNLTAGTYTLKGPNNADELVDAAKIIYDAMGDSCLTNPYEEEPQEEFSCTSTTGIGLSISLENESSGLYRAADCTVNIRQGVLPIIPTVKPEFCTLRD